MKVLTVDDNPMTGMLLADALKDLGHEPFTASDATTALDVFERAQPQVCILDWMMPETDGLQIACAIRKHRHGAGVYIIMLTAKSDLESIGLAYELGIDEFMVKPVAPGELKVRLHAASRLVELHEQHSARCQEVAALTAEVTRLKSTA